MKRMLRVVLAVAAATAAGPAPAADETIAVFTKNLANPHFHGVRVGSEAAARAFGAKVIQYVPTKPDSIPEQVSQVEDAIARRPDAIVFIPVHFEALVPALEKINAAGIPVVNITDRIARGRIVSYVGVDDYATAVAAGRALFDAIGRKGNVVMLEGFKGTITNTDRVRGIRAALEEFPGVTLLASRPANYQRLAALQTMENLLQSFPRIDGVIGLNDPMAIGAIEALDHAGRKAVVIGINGSKEAVALVKSGKLLATGDFHSFNQGCLGVEIAVRHLRKEPVPTELILEPMVIDRTNYQDFETPIEQRSCPSLADMLKK